MPYDSETWAYFSVGLVYQQFAVDVEEQHGVFVFLFEDPASTVLAVYLCLDVFVADFLFGEQFVAVVEHLEVGLAVNIVDDSVHEVAADCVTYHINIVGVMDVFVHNGYVSHMIVVPVGVAVYPEAGPEDWAWG